MPLNSGPSRGELLAPTRDTSLYFRSQISEKPLHFGALACGKAKEATAKQMTMKGANIFRFGLEQLGTRVFGRFGEIESDICIWRRSRIWCPMWQIENWPNTHKLCVKYASSLVKVVATYPQSYCIVPRESIGMSCGLHLPFSVECAITRSHGSVA